MRGKWDGVGLRGDCGVSWAALSVECACVDDLTNGVSVISHRPILLGGGEGGHLKRWVMLAGQSRPSRAGEHQGQKSRSPAPFIHPCPHRILGLCLRLMPIRADLSALRGSSAIRMMLCKLIMERKI